MGERMPGRGWGLRKLLWLGGLGAALGLARRAQRAEATDHQPLIVGEINTATSQTMLRGNVDGRAVLRVDQLDAENADVAIFALGGPARGAIFGIGGDSTTSAPGGTGVAGQGGKSAVSDGVGVFGGGGGPTDDNRGDGVRGITVSPTFAGVAGFNFGSGPAVRGHSAVPTGGIPSPTGTAVGVEGKSGGGRGVHGAASAGGGVGVLAEHTASGLGLAVKGRAGFSTGGSDSIAAGQAQKAVSNAGVTTASHIGVTLVGDPGTPGAGGGGPPGPPRRAHLLWVERRPGTGFVVHMTDKVVNTTPFTYLITEPYSQ